MNYATEYSPFPAALMTAYFVFIGVLIIYSLIVHWRIFTKAGREGWECIIPIYNIIILLKIVGKPWWWILMFIIPGVNIVFIVWTYNMLSKSFGKDEAFTVGLVFLKIIFISILAFGKSKYLGPYGDQAAFLAHNNQDNGGFDFDKNL